MSEPTQPDGGVSEPVDQGDPPVLDTREDDTMGTTEAPSDVPEDVVGADPVQGEQVTEASGPDPATSDADSEEAAEETPAKEVSLREPTEDARDFRIRALEDILEDKEKTLHKYIRAYKQAQADLEAFKKRLRREHSDEVFAAQARSTEALIDVLDNLRLSLDAAKHAPSVAAVAEGVRIVADQFRSVLRQQGLEEISPTGQPFDPTCMEAMSVIAVTDAAQDNLVLATLKPGYRIGEREVRPALVQVGRKTA